MRDEKIRDVLEVLYEKARKGFSLPAGLDDIIKLKKLTINQALFQLNELYKPRICPYCKSDLTEKPLGNPDKGYGGEVKC